MMYRTMCRDHDAGTDMGQTFPTETAARGALDQIEGFYRSSKRVGSVNVTLRIDCPETGETLETVHISNGS